MLKIDFAKGTEYRQQITSFRLKYISWLADHPNNKKCGEKAFSNLVAIEFQKVEFFNEGKGVTWSYFLNDLLSEKLSNEQKLRERAKKVGWLMSDWFQIIAVIDYNKVFSEKRMAKIGKMIRNIIPAAVGRYRNMDSQ